MTDVLPPSYLDLAYSSVIKYGLENLGNMDVSKLPINHTLLTYKQSAFITTNCAVVPFSSQATLLAVAIEALTGKVSLGS